MAPVDKFGFNIKKARKTIVVFVISSVFLIVLLISTKNKISNNLDELVIYLLFGLVIYLFIVFKLLTRLFLSENYNSKSITIINGSLSVPTFYLGEKIINLENIYSSEIRMFRKTAIGITLGIKRKGIYFIEKERFSDATEFKRFCDYMDEYLRNNRDLESREEIGLIAVKNQDGHIFFSYIFVFLAILFFLIGLFFDGADSQSSEYLLAGANTKRIINNLEIYRIASSIFLHASIIHLMLNVFMIGVFSELLERVLSYVRYANLFLISSLFAVLTSVFFSSFDASIGASGGIFGLWGAYTYLKINFENRLPGTINAIPSMKLYFVLVIEIIFEIFIIKNVDYLNHLGGFVSGFAYMYIIPVGDKLENINSPTFIEKIVFISLLLFYFFGLVFFSIKISFI